MHRINVDVGQQLPMFVDPVAVMEETYERHWDSIDNDDGYIDELWDLKLEQSTYNGYTDTIYDWEIFHPVTVMLAGMPELGNGHHRIVTAAEVGMPLIPVVWSYYSMFSSADGDNTNPGEEYIW